MLYVILFRVIDGFDTLDELEKLPVREKSFRPLTNIALKSITIHANPIACGLV
jgi:peptidyl-prolyl cis-trans isomerase-like 3